MGGATSATAQHVDRPGQAFYEPGQVEDPITKCIHGPTITAFIRHYLECRALLKGRGSSNPVIQSCSLTCCIKHELTTLLPPPPPPIGTLGTATVSGAANEPYSHRPGKQQVWWSAESLSMRRVTRRVDLVKLPFNSP